MRRPRLRIVASLVLAGIVPATAAAAPAAHVPGEVLVGLEAHREPLRLLLPDGADPVAASAALAAEPGVAWAEPNHLFHTAATPDDPLFGTQWGLLNTGQIVRGTAGTPGADIRAPLAWDRTAGDASVLAAVIDGGVDLAHPDLTPNLAVNAGEIGEGREANGIDDDANGAVDDVRGWDFADGDADPTERDPDSHGSHVTGTLAAAGGNGIGISGVAQRAAVVPVRALDASGAGTADDIAAGFRYASLRGARVVNASLGGGTTSRALESAIREAPNTLFIVASGNEGQDVDRSTPSYPCVSTAPNLLCVTATDQSDRLPSFANVGATSVDLGAPGVNVLSTVAGSGYGFKTGTSMATPHVSGAAVLALAASPGLSTSQLRQAVLDGAVRLPALSGSTTSGARLSAAGTLAALPAPAAGPPALTQPAQAVTGTSARLTGATRAAGQAAVHYFEFGTTTAYGRRTPQRVTGSAEALAETVSGLTPGTTYHARLVTATVSGISFGPDVSFTTTAPPAPPARPSPVTSERPDPSPPPRLAVRQIGRAWLASLALPQDAVVGGRLERRLGGRWVTVRSFRRRGVEAGRQAFALGPLRAGHYRVVLTVARGAARTVVSESFRVDAPLAGGLHVRRRAGGWVAALSVAAPARAGGRIVRLGGGRPFAAPIRPRALRPGPVRTVPLAPRLAPGRYRVRLILRAAGRRHVLTHAFTVPRAGGGAGGVLFRSRTT